MNSSSPFGSSIFSTPWINSRDRSSTLHSIQSSNGPTSPAQSSFSKDGLADTDVKTLDYLGLVDTPQQPRAILEPSPIELLLEQQRQAYQTTSLANANRYRSYSVNAKEKYAEEEDDYDVGYPANYSGTITPSGEGANAAAYAIHEAVRQHNLEVQAFASLASASRPRARTAGVLDSPSTRLMRNYLPTPSRLDNTLTAADIPLSEEAEYSGLTEAVQKMNLNGKSAQLDVPGDENILEGPTRALWLGNIPASTTVSSLNVIFANYGTIESTRVLTHKNCGFVNFESLESAIRAKSQLNGKEIFPGAGPVRIGFAKVPSASATPGNNSVFPSSTPDPMAKGQTEAPTLTPQPGSTRTINSGRLDLAAVPFTAPNLSEMKDDIAQIVKELGATEEEVVAILSAVDEAFDHDHYETEVPSIPEPSHNRVHDAPRLREIRKRIDNNSCSGAEIEEVAMGMIPEIAELSSDYLGNTVVQKLFEFCTENVKQSMLEQIAPHLAEIGVHKNGTWAAQKIIDVARSPSLMAMVVESLRPYSMALFLDQFGNYVMQGCLRYQYPLNNFIFEVMLTRLWDLSQGRFGARAMRACLESHFATKDQQRMIAAAIALHSVQLATNANGALLLTWFLDTCTFPKRRSVLAPRLVPHLVHLCTHKVAYLTVLKIINQRNEPEARDAILQALFFSPNDQVLEEILSDQACGATLIFKVLTTPFFDEKIRSDVVQNVRNVLVRIKAQPSQGYKRLMDEVNLPTRGSRDNHTGRDVNDASRPGSKQGNGHLQGQTVDGQVGRQFFSGMSQGAFDTGMARSGSMDSNGFDQFTQLNAPVFAPNGMSINPQQIQYQQAMLAASAGRGSFYPQLNGFSPAAPSLDNFRSVSGSSVAGPSINAPQMMQQTGFTAPPGFGNMVNTQMYPYSMQYVPQQPVPAGRRNRVSSN
jgi:protein JSN1